MASASLMRWHLRLGAPGAQVRSTSAQHEGLQARLCCLLAAECAEGNSAATPGRLRASLQAALQARMPSPPPKTPLPLLLSGILGMLMLPRLMA
jgi:hypothetical protein